MKLRPIAMVLLVALLGYTGYWLIIAGNSDIFLERLEPEMKARGVSFTYGDYRVTGFPYRIVLEFADPVLVFENGPLSITVEAPGMEAISHPWSFGHVILFLEQPGIEIFFEGREKKEILLKPDLASLSYSRQGKGAYRLSVETERTEFATNLAPDLPDVYEKIALHIRKDPEARPADGALYDPKLLEVALHMAVNEGTFFDSVAAFRAFAVPNISRSGLEEWRDGSGTLEIEKALFVISGRQVAFDGSFTLDEQLRPLGAGGLEAEDARDIIVLLEGAGVLGGAEALILSGVLTAIPPMENTQLSVALPLTVQDGIVSVGPLPVYETGPVIED